MTIPSKTLDPRCDKDVNHQTPYSGSSTSSENLRNPWDIDLNNKMRVLTLKKQLLLKSVDSGDIEDINNRIEDIRGMVRSFEETDIMIHQNANDISITIEDAITMCDIVEAAIRVNIKTSGNSKKDEEEDCGIKLKAMKPPVYYGDEEGFLPWWEQYEVAVHKRKIPESSKHRILIDECLKGHALQVVKGINPNSRNYQTSIATVKERFGDPNRLATFYFEKLEKLPCAKEPKEQLSTYEEVKKILANLTSLEVNTDEKFVREKIVAKFSSSTLMWVWAELRINETTDSHKKGGSIFSRTSVPEIMEAIGEVVNRRRYIQHHLREETQTVTPKKHSKGGNGAAAPAMAGANAASSSQSSESASSVSCVYCKSKHLSKDCKRYGTLKKRRERLVELKRCLLCGSGKHKAANCPNDKGCEHCGKKKHTIVLCVEYLIASRKKTSEEKGKSNNTLTLSSLSNLAGTFMETFKCKIKDADGTYINISGMLDGGSATSYITNNLATKLRLKRGKRILSRLCNFGSKKVMCQSSDEVVVTFKNHFSESRTYSIQTTNCISGVVVSSPPPACVKSILPNNLTYADPAIFVSNQRTFDVLIGIDLYNKIVNLTNVKNLSCGIVLKDSFFGWVPSGSLENNEIITNSNTTYEPILSALQIATTNTLETPKLPTKTDDDEFDKLCSLFWSLEVLGIRSSQLEQTNESVLQKHRDTVRRNEDGRFVVRWPYKKENLSLPSNYRLSLARLKKIFEKSDKMVLQECDKNFKEQLNLGIIEEAPKDSPFLKHYIPWKPVFRNEKIRVVYDASAKTKSGVSLNDLMNAGPKLIGDLVSLIVNFRLFEVGLTADIEKAFLMVGLNEVDRDVTRFLWFKDFSKPPTPDNIIIFRFARTPFGIIASPFLLNIVLQDLLTSINKWLLMARNSFYVDNLVLSVPNTIDAVNLHNVVNPKLASGGFNLRDWTSNDPNFIKAIPGSLPIDSKPISILGLGWDRANDSLAVRVNWTPNSEIVTKRIILKFVSSIYDPLMITAPATLPIKLLIQECWKEKITWDQILPANKLARWFKLYNETKKAISNSFPRRYWSFNGDGTIYLHVFCDASKEAYACSAYLTYADIQNGHFASSIILAKSRIAPPQGLTIPKLELLGVLIGKRLAKYVLLNIKLTVYKLIIWTDATTVIHWLNSTTVQPKFVEARINEIREPLDVTTPITKKDFTVRYVPSEYNPADLATRGTKAEDLFDKPLWWKGPAWLPYPQLWPSPPADVHEYSSRIIPTHPILLINTSLEVDHFLPDSYEKRFSNWDKYARFYGIIQRWCGNILNVPNLDTDTDTFQRGERSLIRALQFKYFQPELVKLQRKIQPNQQLGLFLDEMGIIRCGGRLQNASFPWETIHPILLPRESPLTILYIRKIHEENMHIGCSHVLSKLREKFWIIKGRAKVKSVLHHCVTCRKWSGGSYQLPPMPPLPWVRVAEASPFLFIAVDYFGALNCYRDDGETLGTVYIAIFVCLVTRAIHLELANDLSADEFLMAFIRFSSRRGVPKLVYSDHGTNLKFVQKLVGNVTEIIDIDVRRYFSTNNIRWKFAPPNAPWYRGVCERLVGVVKPSLKKSFGRKQILNYVSLNTALCELENIVNSRPLTYVSDETLQPLTPNHFLRLRPVNANNVVEVSKHRIPKHTRKDMLKTWEQTNAIVEDFWSAFRGLYLLSLRGQHAMIHKHPKGSVTWAPKKNDIVLIQHPSAPRCDWAMGRIMSLDKRQALAKVFTHKDFVTKPINQLFPLELQEHPDDKSLSSNLNAPALKRSKLE